MSKISCDVCLDLIPLVQDGVASNDSKQLVEEHINSCTSCSMIYKGSTKVQEINVNDKKVLKEIKKKLYIISISILIIGSLFGVALSNTMGMFYNFLIMPLLGGIGYLALNKKWYYVPLGIFMMSYIWLFIAHIFEGIFAEGFTIAAFAAPMYMASIYTFLSLIGFIIAALLKFAFKREV